MCHWRMCNGKLLVNITETIIICDDNVDFGLDMCAFAIVCLDLVLIHT